jgi:hypothetical protein
MLRAKRRMGKSTFLERDLISAAKQAGYMTPYLNLWTATHTPAQALTFRDRVWSATVCYSFGNCCVFQPPPSALINRTLASSCRRMRSMSLR